MIKDFDVIHRERSGGVSFPQFGPEAAKAVLRFHQSFPEYRPTPLVSLGALSGHLGLGGIYVKDESFRFGLNAFKALGGSYAIARYIAKRLDLDADTITFPMITGREVSSRLGQVTFVTATDGNHGRGVAWTANRLGQNAVVYMPKGTAPERLKNIRALGADASITELRYDDVVKLAAQNAGLNGWVLVQDTSWPGYEEIPTWIMQGYTTMAMEALEQLKELGAGLPTHIFLQAGVGSMAAAIAGFFSVLCTGNSRPTVTVLEPNSADCFYRTAAINDGKPHGTLGDLKTIMAGLACGEPCTIAWDVLSCAADNFAVCPDSAAAKGMRMLGNPLSGDRRIISGESGASTMGFLAEVMEKPELSPLRERLGLDKDSRVLLISTEGDTDRENYRRVVWDGLFPSF